MSASNDVNKVDVLSLEDFRSTLDARLGEAQSVRTSLTEALGGRAPALGSMPDAQYVSQRYHGLYEQHLDRVSVLIDALGATKTALTSIIETYQTTEARLTADASEIAAVLGSVSGVHNGENSHA